MSANLTPVKIRDVSGIEPQSDLDDVCQRLEWMGYYLRNEEDGSLHWNSDGALYLMDPETSLPIQDQPRFGEVREVEDVVLGGLPSRDCVREIPCSRFYGYRPGNYADFLPHALTALLMDSLGIDVNRLTGYTSSEGLWPGGRLGRKGTQFTFFKKAA